MIISRFLKENRLFIWLFQKFFVHLWWIRNI